MSEPVLGKAGSCSTHPVFVGSSLFYGSHLRFGGGMPKVLLRSNLPEGPVLLVLSIKPGHWLAFATKMLEGYPTERVQLAFGKWRFPKSWSSKNMLFTYLPKWPHVYRLNAKSYFHLGRLHNRLALRLEEFFSCTPLFKFAECFSSLIEWVWQGLPALVLKMSDFLPP